MLEHGSCKLYALSANKNEYKKVYRTLSGDNKMSVWDDELINDTLIAEAIHNLSKEANLYLIHDPSDIRKPHSTKAENLGKVRDLKNNIINGYSTHNIIAITPNSKSVHLISHESYSTENYPKIHTAAPDAEIIFSIVSLEGLYSSKNRSTLYLDNNALIPCRI